MSWKARASSTICPSGKRDRQGFDRGIWVDSRSEEAGAPRPIIRLAGVELRLASAAGEVNILRGLDLEVAAGETVGIVGPSGSGKSTMMMIVAGLERPTAGRVEVAGADLAGLDEDGLARLRRARIGIVFQAF